MGSIKCFIYENKFLKLVGKEFFIDGGFDVEGGELIVGIIIGRLLGIVRGWNGF